MDQTTLPIPMQEKLSRWLMYAGIAAAGVAGVITVGPFVLSAINTLFSIVTALLALAGIAIAGALVLYLAVKFIPLIKKGIDIAAYNMWSAMIDKWPVVHMALWLAKVMFGIQESNEAKKELSGIVGENQNVLSEKNDRIKELETTLRDKRVSAATREDAERELAVLLEVRKPYERVVKFFEPGIATLDQFIQVQERYASKLRSEIEVAEANVRATASINKGLKVWDKVMGRSQAKIDYETARARVKNQMGNSLGRLEDMRKQMSVMVRAAASQDEIAMANARSHVEKGLHEIDVPVEVKPAVTTDRRLLNFN